MIKTVLATSIFCLSFSAHGQDYGVPVKHAAQSALSYSVPLFSKPDSTGTPIAMVPAGKEVYVLSQRGPWYRVSYDNIQYAWAVARTLAIPGTPGRETVAPCPDANAVVVFSDDAPADAWKKACQALLGSGFALAGHEADLLTFSSSPKALGKTIQLTLTGFVQPGPAGKGAIVTLSGAYTYLLASFTAYSGINSATIARPAAFRGGPGQGDRMAFSAVDQVAHAYAGGVVKYALR